MLDRMKEIWCYYVALYLNEKRAFKRELLPVKKNCPTNFVFLTVNHFAFHDLRPITELSHNRHARYHLVKLMFCQDSQA